MADSLNDNMEKKMRKMKAEGGDHAWTNKQSILFRLEVMYGSMFNKEQASMLYDKITKEDNEPE